MKKYQFSNVVFTPDGPTKLFVDNQPVPLKKLQANLLQYFLDNHGKVSSKNKILESVWGPGDFTHAALAAALNKLKNKLPPDVVIENIHGEGYVFRHDVKVTEWRFKGIESFLINSRHTNIIVAAIVMLSLAGFAYTFDHFYHRFNPAPTYTLEHQSIRF